MYWITGILGPAFIVAPFVLGYMNNPAALWSSVILRTAMVVVPGLKVAVYHTANWESWAIGILGLAASVTFLMLSFNPQGRWLDASIILGAIVVVLTGYQPPFAYSQTR